MPPDAPTVLSVAALVLAFVALVVATLVARRTVGPAAAQPTAAQPTAARLPAGGPDPALLPAWVPDPTALRHVAVVRYDAFSDVGGRLSYSMAVVDDTASGFVLTTLAGKSDVRTYVRAISGGGCEGTLTDEEQQAIIAAVGSRQ